MDQSFVDVDSGEMVRLLRLKKTRRYAFPGGYFMAGRTNITRLLKADVSDKAKFLALLMASKVDSWTCLVHCSNRQYAEELGVTPISVCRLIGQLAKANFIHRTGPRLVMVNPGWCFCGTPEQHHAAIEQWCKLHPLKAVGKEEAA